MISVWHSMLRCVSSGASGHGPSKAFSLMLVEEVPHWGPVGAQTSGREDLKLGAVGASHVPGAGEEGQKYRCSGASWQCPRSTTRGRHRQAGPGRPHSAFTPLRLRSAVLPFSQSRQARGPALFRETALDTHATAPPEYFGPRVVPEKKEYSTRISSGEGAVNKRPLRCRAWLAQEEGSMRVAQLGPNRYGAVACRPKRQVKYSCY